MPFGLTYEAIEDLIRKTALDVRMARAIARRAGVRASGASTPRTVIDDYIGNDQHGDALRMQWAADLTKFSRVRFASSSTSPIYVMCAPQDTASYDAGDYAILSAVDEGGSTVNVSASAGGTPEWLTIPDQQRIPLRFVLSTSSGSVSETLGETPFRVVLEIF